MPHDGPATANTELLRLVPPRWNEEEQMYQLSYEGRACCMSNKNVQLANAAEDENATLQVTYVTSEVTYVASEVTAEDENATLQAV